MILDERTEFADGLQPAAGVLGDVVDLWGTAYAGSAPQNRDVGAGHPIYWVTTLETAVGGGPGTISLITADNAALSTNPVTLASISVPATTAAGSKWAITLPQGMLYKQFLGVSVGGTALTGGTVSSFLVLDVSNWRAYKDAAN